MSDWVPAIGFPGYFVNEEGEVLGKFGRVMKPQYNKYTNRYHVTIHIGRGQLVRPIHRLVLEAFVGLCPGGMEGCHNDGDSSNNCLSNLRWDTHVNNEADKVIHGTNGLGTKNSYSKATEEDVRTIRQLHKRGHTYQSIADQVGLGKTTVSHIVRGNTWAHVGEES